MEMWSRYRFLAPSYRRKTVLKIIIDKRTLVCQTYDVDLISIVEEHSPSGYREFVERRISFDEPFPLAAKPWEQY